MDEIGDVWVPGPQTRELACELLAACQRAGTPVSDVRSSDGGFLLPVAVYDEMERAQVPSWAPSGAVF